MHNHTFWTRGPEPDAPPYLGGVRVNQYMDDLTQYLRMLRAGFPDTRLVAVHTMAQRSARQKSGPVLPRCDCAAAGQEALQDALPATLTEHCDEDTNVRRYIRPAVRVCGLRRCQALSIGMC